MQAKDISKRKDILLAVSYGLGMLILTGVVSGTFYPAREGGGIAFNEVLLNLGGATPETAVLAVSVGFVLAVGSSVIAFISNRVMEGDLNVKGPETVAGVIAIGTPVAHETVDQVGEITTGDPLMQTLFFGGAVISYVYIADMP